MAEYIEREAVMLQINIADFVRDDNYEAGATLLFQDDVVDRISSIPAADVRPVVKAQWVYTDMSRLVCSNCGNPVAFALKDDGWHHGDYCPNCGARMEES